jgi:glycosyltransferase involved in cell wall biosynthesis
LTRRPPLKVLSIAHVGVSRDRGRLRYHPLAQSPDLDVHLLVPERWREYGRNMIADAVDDVGLTVHVEPILLPYLPRVNWYGHFYPRLRSIIRKVEPDVIHLAEEPWSVVALQASRLRGDAALVVEVEQNILRRLPQPFESIRRHVLKQTDAIVSRSPEATVVARACGFKGSVKSLGYGVNQGVFTPARAGCAPRLSSSLMRMGYVGRLVEEKGIDEALTAIALSRSPVSIALMGEGPHERALRQRVRELGLEDRVSFRGWGSLQDVATFLRSLDVSFLLSRSTITWREQFGRMIIESQSCGVPVIGSTSGAIPDVIGRGGWVVPERDPNALTQLLDGLSRTPHEISTKAAAGLDNVATRFTPEKIARALADAWREAYAAYGGGRSAVDTSKDNLLPDPRPEVRPYPEEKARAFRVVQVVGELGTTGGGVETAAYELAKAWRRTRVPHRTITRQVGSGVEKHLDVDVVSPWLRCIPIRGASPVRYLGRLIVVPVFCLASTARLRDYRDAVILSHNGDPLSGDVLVVHSLHAGIIEAKKREGIWSWVLNPLFLWLAGRDRFMIRGLRYRRYVAVSTRVANELKKHHNVPDHLIITIPNGIDLEKFKPDADRRRRVREKFEISPRSKLLLFVGNDYGRKGLAHVIGALKGLPDDVCLLVAGAGDSAAYRQLIAHTPQRLAFAGETMDMPALYAAADALVLPSYYETFSLVCMEALASGIPIFSTRVGGVEDYLKDGVNGYFITRDSADIAAKVVKVFRNPEMLAAMRKAARESASNFDWDGVARRYTALLREVWAEKFGGEVAAIHATDEGTADASPSPPMVQPVSSESANAVSHFAPETHR